MNGLKQIEINFLRKHDIPNELLFDASGQSVSKVKAEMKAKGKRFAFNTTKCNKGGHTIRTRSGHCIQCNTARVAYMNRHESAGIFYVMQSSKKKLFKVGFTSTKKEERSDSLNRTNYGSINDWVELFTFNSSHAGKLETYVKQELCLYLSKFGYAHDGHTQHSSEIFDCTYSQVKDAIILVAKKLNLSIDGLIK